MDTHHENIKVHFVYTEVKGEVKDRRQETGDRRQETGDRRQETETGDRRQETGDKRQETGYQSEALRHTQTMRQGKLFLTHLNFKSTSCHFWFTISADSLHQKLPTQEHKNKHTHAHEKRKARRKLEIREVEKETNFGQREWLRHLHNPSGGQVAVWTLKFEKKNRVPFCFTISVVNLDGPKLSLADRCL